MYSFWAGDLALAIIIVVLRPYWPLLSLSASLAFFLECPLPVQDLLWDEESPCWRPLLAVSILAC